MRRYTAKMEFFAVADEVENLLEQGASYVLAFEKLQNEKKITMSYFTFYAYARKKRHSKKSISSSQSKKISNTTAAISNNGPVFAGFEREKSITEMLHPTPEEQDELFVKD